MESLDIFRQERRTFVRNHFIQNNHQFSIFRSYYLLIILCKFNYENEIQLNMMARQESRLLLCLHIFLWGYRRSDCDKTKIRSNKFSKFYLQIFIYDKVYNECICLCMLHKKSDESI